MVRLAPDVDATAGRSLMAPEAVPAVYIALRRSDRILVTPALLVILLAGLYMVSDAKLQVSEFWISWGLTVWKKLRAFRLSLR